MNHNRRYGREDTGRTRDAGQRTPRSGGRTAAQRASWGDAGVAGLDSQPRRGTASGPVARESVARARGAHELPEQDDFPVRGSVALRAHRAGDPPAVRVWDSTGEPDRATRSTTGERVPRPRLRVAPPLPVAVPRAPFTALVLALVIGGVLGILVINTKINENSFRQHRLQEQQAALDLEQQRLEKEIADRKAPGNLAAQARKLGLVDPGPPAFIRLPDGQLIGVPQPAPAGTSVTSQPGAGG